MISDDALTDALHDMFEFAPTAFCISTAGGVGSRYLKVNPAYLTLVGRSWDEINRKDLTQAGSAIDSEGRRRRMDLLESSGFYKLEEVDIRHASGALIPTLISAQRRIIGGEPVDIEVIIDNSERKQAQAEFDRKLTDAAFTDWLTGLPNRAMFDRALAESLGRPSAAGALVGLAFIDLNGFKSVNDRFGHAAGDGLLRTVARRLRSRSLPSHLVARLGGDEFAVVFESSVGAERQIEKHFTRLAREAFAPVRIADLNVDVDAGAAIGIALLPPGSSPEMLLQSADQLMYAAKKTAKRLAVSTSWSPLTFVDAA